MKPAKLDWKSHCTTNHQQLLTALWAIRGRRELQKVSRRANVTGDGLVFFHAGRGSDELMLLVKPEEWDVRVDTKRRDKKALKWSEIIHNHRASGGVSKESRQRTSAFAGEWKACKKGEECTSNEKASFASILFKTIPELLHWERAGGRKKRISQEQSHAVKNLTGVVESIFIINYYLFINCHICLVHMI